jgi:hypothetical protein
MERELMEGRRQERKNKNLQNYYSFGKTYHGKQLGEQRKKSPVLGMEHPEESPSTSSSEAAQSTSSWVHEDPAPP